VTCSVDGPAELFALDDESSSGEVPAKATRTARATRTAKATATTAKGAAAIATQGTGSSAGRATARARRGADAQATTVTTDKLEVWTDGACSGNPGPGGWAWATRDGRQGSGGATDTTNQRMEIQAAAEAITTLTERPLVVVSDSTYVVNCFRDGWWKGWLARGWTNSQKKPVANRDLWEPLIAAYQQGGVSFRWVKGHSGDEMNDLVDRLAVAAGQQQRA